MTTEEKFKAAVNVIRSLPKNGSYQPSNELMLRFYAYFKQATHGPNVGKRPAFYDVVGRAKYDAWKKLGEMSKAEAMSQYVTELHSIVETMSLSEKVANFLETPTNELETISLTDLELVAGDVIDRFRSHPNSPFGSREASPTRTVGSSGDSSSPQQDDSDHSDDEYIDTIEFPESRKHNNEVGLANGVSHVSRTRTKFQSSGNSVDISQEVSRAVQSLKSDIDRLSNKINLLENSAKRSSSRQPRGLPMHLLAFIILWPFVATFVMNRYVLKRK